MALRDRFRRERSPQDEFADEVAGLIPRFLPVERVERGDDFSLRLVMPGRPPVVLFLENIFTEASRLEGDARDERLRTAVLAMMPTERPETWADARDRVLPSLRSASWAAASTQGDRSPVRRPFAPFVQMLVALDSEYAMSFVSADDARRWGVGWDELTEAAAGNLTRAMVSVAGSADGFWLDVLGPDGYVSSWLTLPTALERFAASLGDEFVAVAKSRDSLRLLAATDRSRLATELRQIEDEYRTEPRQLSPVPFCVRGGEVVPWEPEPEDPCRPVVDRLQRILALCEYSYQLNVLVDLFQRTGEDVFVAKYALVARTDETVWSWAAWPRQVSDGLLPRVDLVFLGDTEAGTGLWVRWDDAIRVAGDSLREVPGYEPPRWRVTGWPDDTVVAELRRLAVDPATDP